MAAPSVAAEDEDSLALKFHLVCLGSIFYHHNHTAYAQRPGFCYRGRSKPNASSKRSTAFSSPLVSTITCRSVSAFSRYSGFRSTRSMSKVNRGTVSSFNGTNAPVFVLEPTPLHDLGNRHSQALGAKQVLSVPDFLSPACGPPGAAGSSVTLAA